MAGQQCQCSAGDLDSATYRFGNQRHTYNRCNRCGREWTQTEMVPDMGDVVTSDELVEVHALLEGDKTLEELIG